MADNHRTMVRLVIIFAAPIMLPWAFISTLCREFGRSLRYAWLEVRAEFDSAKLLWRNGKSVLSSQQGEQK